MKKYERKQLEVLASFGTDGALKPFKLIYKDRSFEITKVKRVRRHCPQEVGCIAPLEYTVIVDGVERKIYFEQDSNTWFSVKEVYSEQ